MISPVLSVSHGASPVNSGRSFMFVTMMVTMVELLPPNGSVAVTSTS